MLFSGGLCKARWDTQDLFICWEKMALEFQAVFGAHFKTAHRSEKITFAYAPSLEELTFLLCFFSLSRLNAELFLILVLFSLFNCTFD
jgi:hypothetical protein